MELYGGAVWNSCSLVKIASVDIIDRLYEELWWIPSEKRKEIIEIAIESGKEVLAGYASEGELVYELPDEAEPIEKSRYGDYVYFYDNKIFEPYYIAVYLIE